VTSSHPVNPTPQKGLIWFPHDLGIVDIHFTGSPGQHDDKKSKDVDIFRKGSYFGNPVLYISVGGALYGSIVLRGLEEDHFLSFPVVAPDDQRKGAVHIFQFQFHRGKDFVSYRNNDVMHQTEG